MSPYFLLRWQTCVWTVSLPTGSGTHMIKCATLHLKIHRGGRLLLHRESSRLAFSMTHPFFYEQRYFFVWIRLTSPPLRVRDPLLPAGSSLPLPSWQLGRNCGKPGRHWCTDVTLQTSSRDISTLLGNALAFGQNSIVNPWIVFYIANCICSLRSGLKHTPLLWELTDHCCDNLAPKNMLDELWHSVH